MRGSAPWVPTLTPTAQLRGPSLPPVLYLQNWTMMFTLQGPCEVLKEQAP